MATDYVSRLQAIPLFDSLSEAELGHINSIVRSASYSTDQVIFTVGEKSDKLYIIDTGQVRVRRRDSSGAETISRFLGPGQFVGEVGLLRGEPRNATVEAVVDTTLFTINKDDFLEMLARFPSIRVRLEAAARSREVPLSRFDWQEPDEVAVWVAHRNVIPFIFESLPGLALRLGIAVVIAVLAVYLAGRSTLSPGIQVLMIAVAVALFSLTWAWYIVDWTNDYLVVTNRRIVHVERYGLIREIREEIPVQVVQDVVLQHSGLLAAMLGLADITVASIGGKLSFTHAPRPEHIQQLILDQRTRIQHESRREERKAIRDELLKVVVPTTLVQAVELEQLVPNAQGALVLVPAPETQPAEPPPAPSAASTIAASQAAVPGWRRRLRPAIHPETPDDLIWRKHWLILARHFIGPTIVLLMILTASITLWLATGTAPWPLLFIVLDIGYFGWEYGVWNGDVYILSTNRIIDIERLPLGLRSLRRESTLDRIQDIDVVVPNVIATLFDMGNVTIKTAAGGADFVFLSVPHPHTIQRDVFHRLAEFRRKEQEQERRQRFEEMAKWLKVYNELTTHVPAQKSSENLE
jgi:hypothetical protein